MTTEQKMLDYVPWEHLTSDVLSKCVDLKDQVKKKPGAQGIPPIWLNFNFLMFNKMMADKGIDCKIKFAHNSKLTIKTPFLRLPFGISEYLGKESVVVSFEMSPDPKYEEFEVWCRDVFNPFILEAYCKLKNKTIDVVKPMFKGIWRHDEDSSYGPKTSPGKFLKREDVKATHGEGNVIPFDEEHIRANDYASLTLALTHVWQMGGSAGQNTYLQAIDIRSATEMFESENFEVIKVDVEEKKDDEAKMEDDGVKKDEEVKEDKKEDGEEVKKESE